MTYLFKAGGAPMWLILVFGALSLVVAGAFAWRPSDGKLGLLRAMSAATAFTSVAGFAGGMAMTLYASANLPLEKRPDAPIYVMLGTSESLSNLIFGFTLLSLVWLVAAVGFRRIASEG